MNARTRAGVPLRARVGALLVVGAAFACAGCQTPLGARPLVSRAPAAEPLLPDALVVFTGALVFSAHESEPWLPDHDVALRGERIVAVRPAGQPWPAGSRLVPAEGLTLLPGLIDTHVHLGLVGAAPWAPVADDVDHNLQAHLYAGVTTVMDLGGDAALLRRLRGEIARGARVGPRLFFTLSPLTGPGSHPVPLGKDFVGFPLSSLVDLIVPQAATPAAARALVAERVAAGVDYVKITFDDMPPGTPRMTEEVLRAAIEASHAAGLRAVVHVTDPADMVTAAELGADLLAHGPYRSTVSPEQARRIAATGAALIPTLVGFAALADATQGAYEPSAWVRESTPASLLQPVTGEAGAALHNYPAMRALAEAAAAGRPTWAASLRQLHDAGVPLFVGTDSALPGTYPGASFHEELALLSAAGLSTETLLLGATSRPARWLAPQPDFGSIEAGMRADLLLVRGDPRADIRALRDIVGVWQAGEPLQRHPPPAPSSAAP